MKKIIIYVILFSIICLFSIFIFRYNNFSLLVEEDSLCDYKAKLYYEYTDYNVYFYCLDNVKIKYDNGVVKNLKSVLVNDERFINKILDKLEMERVYYDGGTKLYKSTSSEVSNLNIKILKCNRSNYGSNYDVFIGNDELDYKVNFCSDNVMDTFVLTFKVLNIKTNEDYDIDGYERTNIVELEDLNGSTFETIIHSAIEVEVGKVYDFEFYGLDIDSIDKKNFSKNLIEVREHK